MATREDMMDWVVAALRTNDGAASVADVAKYVWENYEDELRRSGSLLWTWQYDIRWAAMKLRKQGIIRAAHLSPKGIWELR